MLESPSRDRQNQFASVDRPHIDEYTPRCNDERCDVRGGCFLWLDRNNPLARASAKTLRKNWESHRIPCEVNQQLFGLSESYHE